MIRVLVPIAFVAGLAVGCVGLAARDTHAQSPEVAAALDSAAHHYGVRPAFLRCHAEAESRYQPWARSPGGHMGLMQFARRTWAFASVRAGWAGADPYDPWANADVAAWLGTHAEYGGWTHWPTRRWCGSPWW